MKITRRTPRIKIGNTTYTFGKNGVGCSTRIAKGIRIRTSANGKQTIGGSFLGWRWSQDLDELGRKKTPQELQQIREQRKDELSLGLLFSHPFVFFDHLFRRKTNDSQQNQGTLSQNQNTPLPSHCTPQSFQNQSLPEKSYTTPVTIFKESNGTLVKVTDGMAMLENDRIVVKANVTKEFFYRDILDVHKENGKVFISSKCRSIPLVLEMREAGEFVQKLIERISIGET
jgi:hypothetical protein